MVLVAKRLFTVLRLSACRVVQRESATAWSDDILIATCQRKPLEPAAAVPASPANVDRVAGKQWSLPPHVCSERPHDQQSRMFATSTLYQHIQQEGPDIRRFDPILQQQWDHAANAHLGNIDIKAHSSMKVWWTCDQCPDGHLHRWEARVADRTRGNGCPQCIGRKVCRHNSLATKAPKVAAQWDYEANAGTPDDVVAHSKRPIKWLCDTCGHKGSASPGQRGGKKKCGCPECAQRANGKNRTQHSTFAECQDPHGKAVLAEWDHEYNAPMGNFPHNTTLRSHKQIFWLCNKCPAGQQHSWSAMPNYRNGRSKTGCPFCAGRAACRCNSLQAFYPAVAAEWDYANNKGKPSDYSAYSSYMAWWFSPQRGSWQQSINSRTGELHQRHARLKRIQHWQESARQA